MGAEAFKLGELRSTSTQMSDYVTVTLCLWNFLLLLEGISVILT